LSWLFSLTERLRVVDSRRNEYRRRHLAIVLDGMGMLGCLYNLPNPLRHV
jgi:hypothetical protein